LSRIWNVNISFGFCRKHGGTNRGRPGLSASSARPSMKRPGEWALISRPRNNEESRAQFGNPKRKVTLALAAPESAVAAPDRAHQPELSGGQRERQAGGFILSHSRHPANLEKRGLGCD